MPKRQFKTGGPTAVKRKGKKSKAAEAAIAEQHHDENITFARFPKEILGNIFLRLDPLTQQHFGLVSPHFHSVFQMYHNEAYGAPYPPNGNNRPVALGKIRIQLYRFFPPNKYMWCPVKQKFILPDGEAMGESLAIIKEQGERMHDEKLRKQRAIQEEFNRRLERHNERYAPRGSMNLRYLQARSIWLEKRSEELSEVKENLKYRLLCEEDMGGIRRLVRKVKNMRGESVESSEAKDDSGSEHCGIKDERNESDPLDDGEVKESGSEGRIKKKNTTEEEKRIKVEGLKDGSEADLEDNSNEKSEDKPEEEDDNEEDLDEEDSEAAYISYLKELDPDDIPTSECPSDGLVDYDESEPPTDWEPDNHEGMTYENDGFREPRARSPTPEPRTFFEDLPSEPDSADFCFSCSDRSLTAKRRRYVNKKEHVRRQRWFEKYKGEKLRHERLQRRQRIKARGDDYDSEITDVEMAYGPLRRGYAWKELREGEQIPKGHIRIKGGEAVYDAVRVEKNWCKGTDVKGRTGYFYNPITQPWIELDTFGNEPHDPRERAAITKDYKAANDGELTLVPGTYITGINKHGRAGDGRWLGTNSQGQTGKLPRRPLKFMKLVEDDQDYFGELGQEEDGDGYDGDYEEPYQDPSEEEDSDDD